MEESNAVDGKRRREWEAALRMGAAPRMGSGAPDGKQRRGREAAPRTGSGAADGGESVWTDFEPTTVALTSH